MYSERMKNIAKIEDFESRITAAKADADKLENGPEIQAAQSAWEASALTSAGAPPKLDVWSAIGPFPAAVAPGRCDFAANVNPATSYAGRSQATELELDAAAPRPTLPFNGYGEQVASLYAGLDLRKNF